MKIRFYLAMTAAALVMTNCSQEADEVTNVLQGSKTLTATIESSSRSTVTDGGEFSWATGDLIAVYGGEFFSKYENTGDNVFTLAENETEITPTKYAVYPAGLNPSYESEILKVTLPASYGSTTDTKYVANTNAAMLAEIEDGNNTLSFKHLGGVMRFVVKNIPSGVSSFKFKTNKTIAGEFTVEVEGGDNVIKTSDSEATTNNEVTISFPATTAVTDMTFYVPLPEGEYGNYTVTVGEKSLESTDVTNTVSRASLLLMPVFTYTDNGLTKGTESYVALNGNQEMTVRGSNKAVLVDVAEGTTDATLSLNIKPDTDADETSFTITDGSEDNVSSTDSKATVSVNADNNVSNLIINAPTLTVELVSGTYGTVEAKTATQTLIIGENVTIGKLVLKGGNLKLNTNLTLENAIEIAEGATVEVDLNGKTVTSSAVGFFVNKDASLTISNGTVKATGNAIENLGGTLVINDGTYTTTGTNRAAIYCDGPGLNSDYAWHLTINGGTFKSEQQTAISLQNNYYEMNEDAQGSATLNAGTFDGALYDLYVGTAKVTYVADACKFENNKIYALAITNCPAWINNAEYATSGYVYITAETFKTAVEAGGKVNLGANVEYDAALNITKTTTVDLGSYTMTSSAVGFFVDKDASLTIGNGTVTAVGNAIENLGGTLTINSGTYTTTGADRATIYCDGPGLNSDYAWHLTINGGTFKSEQQTAISLQNNYYGMEEGAQGSAKLNAGTFDGILYDLYVGCAKVTYENACEFKNRKIYAVAISGCPAWINGTEYATSGWVSNNQ